ncbi:hypothetical protein ACOJQI_21255 [Bacillus salacetis]
MLEEKGIKDVGGTVEPEWDPYPGCRQGFYMCCYNGYEWCCYGSESRIGC